MPLARTLLIFLVFFSISSEARLVATDSLQHLLATYSNGDTLKADLLNKLASEYYLTAPEKALDLGFEAVTLSKVLRYKRGEAEGLRQIGIVLWAQGNYPAALKNFMACLKLAEEIRDRQIIADVTGNIGLVYFGLSDFEQARKFHENSLRIQQELKNTNRQAVALNNLGDVSRALQLYDQAIERYKQALALRQDARNLNGVAVNIRNIGNVFEEQGLFEKALEQYGQSMRLTDSLGERRGMTLSRLSIASVYHKQKNYDQAEEFASESIRLAKLSGFRGVQRDAYLLLTHIAEAKKDFQSAFRNFQLYSAYRDSVMNFAATSEIASYRLDYEMDKKQSEIDYLKKDSDLKNTLLVSGAVILVLLVCIAIVLFKNYDNQKNANASLASKNNQIASHRDDLIKLNEEIRAQQEDLMANRDMLAEKSASIAEMNEKIVEINRNLEKIVADRTAALEQQNQQLIEYAFINAHKLRGPLARVMGLTNLLTLTSNTNEQKELFTLLEGAASELDDVTRAITKVVDKGLDVFQEKNG